MRNPRRDAKLVGAAEPATSARRQPGEPIRPTFTSVIVRSVLAIGVFLAVTLATGTPASQVIPVALVLFVFMAAFGYVFDKWFYRWRMKRWEARRAGRKA